jgi:hypothetical protein
MSSLFYMFALTTTAFLYNWFIYNIVAFRRHYPFFALVMA